MAVSAVASSAASAAEGRVAVARVREDADLAVVATRAEVTLEMAVEAGKALAATLEMVVEAAKVQIAMGMMGVVTAVKITAMVIVGVGIAVAVVAVMEKEVL